MIPRRIRLAIVLLSLGSTACVESGVYDQALSQLADAKRASARKDDELRAYGWQAAALSQQLRDAQARGEARERDLSAQVRELAAANAALAERLKKVESDRAALALTAEPPPDTQDGKRGALRPEDVRRLIAAAEARSALVLQRLDRIERALALPRPAPGEGRQAPAHHGNDVVDPWGFGSRK